MNISATFKKHALRAAAALLVLGTAATTPSCSPPEIVGTDGYTPSQLSVQVSPETFAVHLAQANAGIGFSQALVALCYFTGNGTEQNRTLAWRYVTMSTKQRCHWGVGVSAAMFLKEGQIAPAKEGFREAAYAAARAKDYHMRDFWREQAAKVSKL